MGKVFISYRRDDAAGYARAIYDQLTERFATERVFMDVDAIEPGLPFDEVIRDAVAKCEVLLVLIGARWLEPQADGSRRIDDERDFVRLEIGAALARDIRVIPVLLDGVEMPSELALPEALRGLAWRNAIEVSNTRFNSDLKRLADVLAKLIGEVETPTGASLAADPLGSNSTGSNPAAPALSAQHAPRGRYALVAGAAVLGLFVAGWFWFGGVPEAKKLTPDSSSTSSPSLPEYGVVFGSDKTLSAATDEIGRAGRNGIPGALIYYRNAYFASIAPAASQAEADRILGVVRAFRGDAYAARMPTWCAHPQQREGYVECAATGVDGR